MFSRWVRCDLPVWRGLHEYYLLVRLIFIWRTTLWFVLCCVMSTFTLLFLIMCCSGFGLFVICLSNSFLFIVSASWTTLNVVFVIYNQLARCVIFALGFMVLGDCCALLLKLLLSWSVIMISVCNTTCSVVLVHNNNISLVLAWLIEIRAAQLITK